MHIAFAARASFQIIFKVRVLRRGAPELFDNGSRKRSSAKIGVQDHSSGIDHRLE
jgi:hypothetical protein